MAPFTPEAFELQRAAGAKLERRDRLLLAAVAVGLGVSQLLFLRWADVHLQGGPKLAIAGTAFLLYFGLVLALIWRMLRRRRAHSPCCPECRVPLGAVSQRIAVATGRCDACGGQVIG